MCEPVALHGIMISADHMTIPCTLPKSSSSTSIWSWQIWLSHELRGVHFSVYGSVISRRTQRSGSQSVSPRLLDNFQVTSWTKDVGTLSFIFYNVLFSCSSNTWFKHSLMDSSLTVLLFPHELEFSGQTILKNEAIFPWNVYIRTWNVPTVN